MANGKFEFSLNFKGILLDKNDKPTSSYFVPVVRIENRHGNIDIDLRSLFFVVLSELNDYQIPTAHNFEQLLIKNINQPTLLIRDLKSKKEFLLLFHFNSSADNKLVQDKKLTEGL